MENIVLKLAFIIMILTIFIGYILIKKNKKITYDTKCIIFIVVHIIVLICLMVIRLNYVLR